LARPRWAEKEKILSFAGHPLIFREEILGVLAVFTRSRLDEHDFKWLRIFADHAAVAIANARAFEEISELKRRLELENDYLREEVRAAGKFGAIVGESPALQKVLRQIELVAASRARRERVRNSSPVPSTSAVSGATVRWSESTAVRSRRSCSRASSSGTSAEHLRARSKTEWGASS
jgi:hypothetical protein